MAGSGQMRPGVFAELFAELAEQANMRAKAALEETAKLVEERAIQSVSSRSHPYRTPTPASRGGPPAMVSGTLAKSIGHSTVEFAAGGSQVKVGMIAGRMPPYRSRVDSSMYAFYLEVSGAGRARAKYPFLRSAFDQVAHVGALTTFKRTFAGLWG